MVIQRQQGQTDCGATGRVSGSQDTQQTSARRCIMLGERCRHPLRRLLSILGVYMGLAGWVLYMWIGSQL